MLKFVHLFKHYYIGISFIGIAAFVIQEIPYIIMPLIKPDAICETMVARAAPATPILNDATKRISSTTFKMLQKMRT